MWAILAQVFLHEGGKSMSSIHMVPWTELAEDNRLPDEFIFEWAEEQINLSKDYFSGKVSRVSDEPGLCKMKDNIMLVLKEKFSIPSCILDYDKAISFFDHQLEDPGMLKNFIFFDAINSDDMLLFFYYIWNGEMARSLEAVFGEGYDLCGNFRPCPKHGTWYKMICYESMTINERLKAKFEAKMIVDCNCKFITYFGGGIPHLHHFNKQACRDRSITILDNGYHPSEKDMQRFSQNYDLLRFYDVSILNIPCSGCMLDNTQDIIVMSGTSMYLYNGDDRSKMIAVMKNAARLLRSNGIFMYDVLLPTTCMQRLAITQKWPLASKMKIFTTVDEAISEARHLVECYNSIAQQMQLQSFYLDGIKVNNSEPWGPTSVYFILRKV